MSWLSWSTNICMLIVFVEAISGTMKPLAPAWKWTILCRPAIDVLQTIRCIWRWLFVLHGVDCSVGSCMCVKMAGQFDTLKSLSSANVPLPVHLYTTWSKTVSNTVPAEHQSKSSAKHLSHTMPNCLTHGHVRKVNSLITPQKIIYFGTYPGFNRSRSMLVITRCTFYVQ